MAKPIIMYTVRIETATKVIHRITTYARAVRAWKAACKIAAVTGAYVVIGSVEPRLFAGNHPDAVAIYIPDLVTIFVR